MPPSGGRAEWRANSERSGEFPQGEFSSPEQMKETLGGPVRPAARGTAGAHIAKLIKTMLEKKASGIDLK